MRRAQLLVLVSILLLAACAGAGDPVATPSPVAEPATASAGPPTPPASSRANALDAGPTERPRTPAPVAVLDAEPTLPPATPPLEASPATPPAADALDPGALWPRFLREIDLGVPAGNSYNPHSLVADGGAGRLYVRTRSRPSAYDGAGTVAVLDASSGEVLAVAETGPDPYGEGDLVLDKANGRLYALNPGDTTCSVLDAGSLDTITHLDGVDRLALDVAGERLYVAGPGGLRVLDAANHDLLGEAPIEYAPDPEFLALAAGYGPSRLYLAYRDAGGFALGRHDADTLAFLGSTRLPGRPVALLADPNRERLYLTVDDGEHDLLWTLDAEGRLLDEQTLGEWTQQTYLALDPEGDRLFLARDRYNDHGITFLDLETGRELGELALTLAPSAVAWDGARGQLLVSHTYAHSISAVPASQAGTGAGPKVYPTALELVDVAADGGRGQLYVTDSAGRLHVLDSETDRELALLPAAGRIALDSPHGRLYTGGAGAQAVRVFDAESLQQSGEIRTGARPVADAYHGGLYLVEQGIYSTSLETMTVTGAISDTLPQNPGYSPNPAAVDAVVDAGSGRVFALINNGVPGSNNGNYLHVYEPDTYQRVLADTERSPAYADVDPTTGLAYVSRTHLAGQSTSLLEDGRAYTARLDSVFGPLAVDPVLGRVYLTHDGGRQGRALILDAVNLDVLNSVPVSGTLVALDTERHWLYLDVGQGRLHIWSATGGEPPRPAASPPPPKTFVQQFVGPAGHPLLAQDEDQHLYRSDDVGATWQWAGTGLPAEWIADVAFSPAFAGDGTLFAALTNADRGYGVWKSSDGGQSWHMASKGLGDLAVGRLAASPAFAKDGTLFATARRGGLYRSTDAGGTWTALSESYHLPGTMAQPPGALLLSPAYGQDQTLFVDHYGLQRSTDGGEEWTRVYAHSFSSLALSPDYGRDHTLFGWTVRGGLLRSGDGGASWSPAGAGLSPLGHGSGRVLLSPSFAGDRTVYFVWTRIESGAPLQVFRSTDAGESWQKLVGDLPSGMPGGGVLELGVGGAAFLRRDETGREILLPIAGLDWQAAALPPIAEIALQEIVFSPGFAEDGTLFALSERAGILRSEDGGLTWTDTGFPAREIFDRLNLTVTSADATEPANTLFSGTSLGLLSTGGGEGWAPVAGGLPPGRAVLDLHTEAGGSLRAVVQDKGDDAGLSVWLSTDGADTWTRPIPPVPAGVTAGDLVFSPGFATDRTAFVSVSWQRPLRTTGGGPWQGVGPPGDWTLSEVQLSPALDRDGLVLARLDSSFLWRSLDGGDTWQAVDSPWGEEAPVALTLEPNGRIGVVTFSPAYEQDGVLLTQAGAALYRSTDQARTWHKVLDLASWRSQAVFSPDYGRDGTLYLFQGRALYRSIDRGRTWERLPLAPWGEFEDAHPQISPTFAQDGTLLAWTVPGQVYVSSDRGRSWDAIGGPGDGQTLGSLRQVLFTPDYAAGRLLYLVPAERGLYKRAAGGSWLPVVEEHLPPETPTPPPMPTALPTPPPAPVAPPVCERQAERFHDVWQQAAARLGCPTEPAGPVFFGEQPFERGRMIWDGRTHQIYVLFDGGAWAVLDDTWTEDQPVSDPALVPPAGRVQPQRGFGKVWRENLGGPDSAVGWAVTGERPVDGWRQRFERGLLVWFDTDQPATGAAYLLYDEGTWQVVATPAP